MALLSKQKKNLLRAGIASIYIVGMVVLYGSDQEVVWWFWMWPLAIAIVFYNLILWFGRCPACREEFALEPGDRGFLFTTFTCNSCGAQCNRINGGMVVADRKVVDSLSFMPNKAVKPRLVRRAAYSSHCVKVERR